MKLSEMRTCDGCGGPLLEPKGRWFQVVRTSGALVTSEAFEIMRAAARHGVPLERIEADRTADVVLVLGDREQALLDEIVLCVACYHDRPIAEVVRRRRETLATASATGRAS